MKKEEEGKIYSTPAISEIKKKEMRKIGKERNANRTRHVGGGREK